MPPGDLIDSGGSAHSFGNNTMAICDTPVATAGHSTQLPAAATLGALGVEI